jgi:DNA-binding CsgD family transcriptional regulator
MPLGGGVETPIGMSAAEREIVELVLGGLSNEAIGARRGTSARTVANQLQSIYRKFGVASRLELVSAVRRFRPS